MNEFLPEFVVDETVDIAAPVGRVWEAIVDTPARAAWWPYLNLDATVGGRFEERWTNDDGVEVVTEGQVVDVVSQRLLRLSWADEDWPARTEVEIRTKPHQDGTTVQVRQTGFEHLPQAGELVDQHRIGWRTHLRNLRRWLETPPRR